MNSKSKYNPNIHHRRSIRLKGYDYSKAGLYFITICVQNRESLFGEVQDGKMILNDAGKLVETEWLKLPNRFHNIELYECVVMPNHFHAILEIVPYLGTTLVVAQNQNMVKDQNVAKNDGLNKNIINDKNPNTTESTLPKLNPENDIIHDIGQQYSNSENDIVHDIGQPQGIIEIDIVHDIGQPQGIAPTLGKTVGEMIGAFQSIVTVKYIHGVKSFGWPSFDGKLFQRNYHEHIIRNKQSYQRISEYIINNPKKWSDDKFFKK